MIRALRPAQAPLDEQVLYLAIGGLTNMAIAQGSVCQFTRVIGGGVEQIVAEVAERCAVPVQEARGLIASAQLDEVRAAPDEAPVVADATAAVEAVAHAPESAVSLLAEHAGLSAEPAAPPVAGVRASAGHDKQAIAHAVLVDGVHRIAAEVRNSLEFQRAQAPDCNVTRAVLCGPATDISGFDAALASGVGLPVSCGVVERASGAGNVPASRLAVAAGLAIEQALELGRSTSSRPISAAAPAAWPDAPVASRTC
jgi:type IV pilus assembly protein PilM